MKKALKIILGIVAIAALVGLFMPSEIYVERTMQINKPVAQVFEQVAVLPNWEKWMPWAEMDSTLVCHWSDKSTGLGGYYTWETTDMGEGRLEIIEFEKNQAMKTHVVFGTQGEGNGHWKFVPNSEGVAVSWGLSMDLGSNPFSKIMGPLMESMMGPDFEKGLSNLKKVCENDL